ncbi:AraC family transcriptional regulator [Pseudomonas alkylphenolica]|uniref:AraC family transcriptional regulator n=1 Tax=Pseudomonas alkylphenolica TaxID=237609 RepID=UPI0018D8C502|nr:AraC family transcriptional regulator [Pseudomonas alkylphenolica]MBH3428142.1 AraC family transcriptional regulator [Pseudomonas alkylphenolica]
MSALIRISSLTGFREVALQLGGDPDALLKRFRIDPGLMLEEDARMPLRALVGLLEYAAQTLDCPDFGLRMAAYQDLQVLGPIALIARSSATVGLALADIVRFIGYHSPGIHLDLDTSQNHAPKLVIDIRLPGLVQKRQMVELAMGVGYNTMKLLCGAHFNAQAILLSGASPLPVARYRRLFKATTYPGQACNALVLSAEQLQQPIEQQDPLMHKTLDHYLSHFGASEPANLTQQVERLILRLLPTQRCRLALVAEQLGLHERVLQRRLAEQGSGFETLLEALRRDRAELYLAERNMPMSQVAGLLGFSEQSVFNRACRRWYGTTPKARRQHLLAAAPD